MRTFKSRIDTWVRVVFIAVLITDAGAFLAVSLTDPSIAWTGAIAAAPSALLVGSIWAFTSYRFEGETLRVRSGPFRWTVPLGAVTSVKRTRSAASAPALSLNRLAIEWSEEGRKRSVVVSPDQEQAFIDELRRRSPRARIDTATGRARRRRR